MSSRNDDNSTSSRSVGSNNERSSSSSIDDDDLPESARFELPKMLYRMLYEVSNDENDAKVVSWQEHGRAFRVHNREEFETNILPRYFREKYESWRCLLEQWGFLKLTRGKDRGSWYQSNFVRGQPSSLQNTTKKKFMNGMPTYLSPREEPNLYAMEVAKEDPEYSSSARTNINTTHTERGSTMKKKRASLENDASNAGLETSQSSRKKMKQSQSKTTAPKSSKISPSSSKHIVTGPASGTVPSFVGQGGCRACGVDDDHANLLLCEICETEMHTYCLDPPLDGVPEDDWFCDDCATRRNKNRTELEKAIQDLPASFVKRFGEICWARSGDRAEWWPAEICDPRSFINNEAVVDLARRSIGKKQLVFFFEIQVTPFDALPESRILSWEEGLSKELHTGRHIRGSNDRIQRFNKALAIAKTEFAVDPSERTSSPAKTHMKQLESHIRSPFKDRVGYDDDEDEGEAEEEESDGGGNDGGTMRIAKHGMSQKKSSNNGAKKGYRQQRQKQKQQHHQRQQFPKNEQQKVRPVLTEEEERSRLLMAASMCRYYAPCLF